MDAHLAGKKHRSRVSGRSISLFCRVCEKNFVGGEWDSHISGFAHYLAAAGQQISAEVVPEVGATVPGQTYCELCKRTFDNWTWSSHQTSPVHLRRERYAAFRSVLDEVEKDKHGMTVEGIWDFGVVRENKADAGVFTIATLKTVIPNSRIELKETRLSSTFGSNQRAVYSGFTVTVEGVGRAITQYRPINLRIEFQSSYIGRYEDRLEVVFEDIALKKRFMISRPLRAIVGNPEDHEALKPRAPYVPRSRTVREAETDVIEGVPPPSMEGIRYINRLPLAIIPTDLSSLLSNNSSLSETIRKMRRLYLPSSLNGDTYGRHFKHLIWAEEYKMDRDIERYDIHGATLSKHNVIYYLTVPGLAEKRPSVLVGDRILVQAVGATTNRWFEGHAHVVRKEEVGLRFHSSFAGWSPQQKYTVHFKLNRIPMQRQHQALDTAFTQDRVLFPAQHHVPRVIRTLPPRVYNPLIAANPPQIRAVKSIVNQPPGSAPFVIFGPPGTGKTVTVVEAIRQVLDSNRMAKILVCAPSNSAADLIAQRLQRLTTSQLFRFYAPSRFKDQVPDELLDYTYVRPDGRFSIPPVATMKAYRVVVTTCVSASATETEVMIAIKTMADNARTSSSPGTPSSWAHHPLQCRSESRVEISYLERLMNIDIYDPETGTAVVKLIKNFRSHNAILKFPNDRFYGGDLEPCADEKVIKYYIGSPYLPSKKFPIVFHSIAGKDDREASSPSFFNIDEITQVKSYVEALRADRKYRTTDQDIGVIAPYHAQCVKIRASLRAVADGVKVGSVEEFQGQERRVIIISTVRSSKDFVDMMLDIPWVRCQSSEVQCAVTRAQALLIVIGDPQVLGLTPVAFWESHISGRAHCAAAAEQQIPVEVVPEVGANVPGQKYCELCKWFCIDDSAWAVHQRGRQHARQERYAAFRSVLDEVEKDKHGMTVEGNLNFDIVREAEASVGVLAIAVLKTNIPTSKIELKEVRLSSAFGVNQRVVYSGRFHCDYEGVARTIIHNRPINLKIKFQTSHIGRYEDRLEVVFEDTALKKQFTISRPLRAIVGNPEDHEALKPKAPYVPGAAHDSPLSEIIKRMRRLYLPSNLNGDTYGRHFKHLIWAEEYKMDRDIERYDIHGATLRKHNTIYYLDVPELAEKRPSVLVGDRILVRAAGATEGRWFEGHAHVVQKEEVGLRFHSSFKGWSAQQKYTVHFKLNRIPMRRQHQALDTAFTQDRVLFPARAHQLPGGAQSAPLKMYNSLIATNPPQVRAIQSIVNQPRGSVPFIIFGPEDSDNGGSNTAGLRLQSDGQNSCLRPEQLGADLVAQRLNGLTTRQLFRFYAPSRFKNQVPDGLLEYTHVLPDGHFSVPPVAIMKTYRVIVTTCVSASVASGIGIPRGHFSHIFVDEAGQATETEVMISVKTMADNATNIILSGDPKQLGPIIRSNVARNLGLEISYLERLMNIHVYDPQNGTAVVKLIKNFRSHDAILKFPNDRFYGEFPIVFHSIAGKDDREASSPSFFNIDEITQVKSYVTALRADRKYRTTDQDIGIIAPYHAQCVKIRTSLKAVADGVKVGLLKSSRAVAVTRAQALLIVVGDPQVLGLDPLWRSFLNYIHKNGGWKGPDIPWDPLEPVDGTGYDSRVREAAAAEDEDANVDRPWRDVE
ncbi:P-loop containing nucleoside triphosphate hydrolase protein [Infundibulicybe gibba]|nr:P-loop containing nucleoside triphosphate hydrolase protein [Infundibulicybe gibba]